MSKYDQFINHPSYTSKIHVYLQQYACIVAEASVLCSNPKQAVCLGENLYFQREVLLIVCQLSTLHIHGVVGMSVHQGTPVTGVQ